MKILDYIILTIAVLNLTLGTMSVIEQDYETSIAPYVIGLLLIWYVIINVRGKKRLERELDIAKHNCINLNASSNELMNKNKKLNREASFFANLVIRLHDKTNELLSKHNLFVDWEDATEDINNVELINIPFTEPQEEIDQLHICDKCSTLMLEKEKRYVCPMCKSWKKKEVE